MQRHNATARWAKSRQRRPVGATIRLHQLPGRIMSSRGRVPTPPPNPYCRPRSDRTNRRRYATGGLVDDAIGLQPQGSRQCLRFLFCLFLARNQENRRTPRAGHSKAALCRRPAASAWNSKDRRFRSIVSARLPTHTCIDVNVYTPSHVEDFFATHDQRGKPAVNCGIC